MIMNDQKSIIERFLKKIFGNPWLVCILVTLLSSIAVWFALGNASNNWIRIGVGAIFGFSIGIVHVVEVRFKGSVRIKRTLGGIIGLVTGFSIALLLYPDFLHCVIYSLVGAGLGVTARDWSKYLNFL